MTMTRPLHGFGLGLRPTHYDELLRDEGGAIDWLEIVTENYLVDGGRPLAMLDRIAERWPLAMHGVALNIGGSDPLDAGYLRDLSKLAKRVRPALVSDHLCWTRHQGVQLHDLLPLPHNDDTLRHVATRVDQAPTTPLAKRNSWPHSSPRAAAACCSTSTMSMSTRTTTASTPSRTSMPCPCMR